MNPPRDDIPERHRFDLTEIYEAPADWERDADTLMEAIDRLETRSDEAIESPGDLRELLETAESAYRRKQRLELYANLARNVGTDDDGAADRLGQFREIEADLESAVDALRRRLFRTTPERLERCIAALDEYREYAENLREQSCYALDSDVAEAISAYERATDAPTEVFRAATTEDFGPTTVERPDGQQVNVTPGNVRTELSHPNRDYRRRVYEAYRAELDRFEATMTEALAGKIRAASAETAVRGYESARHRALQRPSYPESGLRCRLPETVFDTMLEAVRDNLEPYHRAQRLRRERLGVETLRPWDREVSIADGDAPSLDYETAREHILTALEPLGEEYVARVSTFFEERRIDVFPTQSKRTDIPAYCPSSAADGAYILSNFREDLRTTFYLCHELGHAMHVEYHRRNPTRYATSPRPMSEVPSLLHELLLVEHLLEADATLAQPARNRLLEALSGNLYGAASNAAFIHEMVSTVEDGLELTPQRTREVWADLQVEFEPVVEFDDRAGRNWLHGWARDLYSNYQYVLGAAGALVVRDRLRDGELTTDTYLSALEQSGRHSSVETFRRLGADPTNPTFYARATERFGGYLDEL